MTDMREKSARRQHTKKHDGQKTIHYCWFGKGDLPESAKKCIDSWKKYYPDYVIKEWNESNFDVNCNDYVREAYESKKYAYVSDFARLQIVYENGGIYFDTDVEVLKRFDDEIITKGFIGLERGQVATGLGFGTKKGNKLLMELLEDYKGIHFIDSDGKMDSTSCVTRNTNTLKRLGYQIRPFEKLDGMVIYPEEYMNPYDYRTGITSITDNTYTIHHYDASWTTEESKRLKKRKHYLIQKYGLVVGKGLYCFTKLKYLLQKKGGLS